MLEIIRPLVIPNETKIVLLSLDGLGGLPHPDTGRSELETARVPNLDALAGRSILGLTDPVYPGVTPGSGPGHLARFGYDPATGQWSEPAPVTSASAPSTSMASLPSSRCQVDQPSL